MAAQAAAAAAGGGGAGLGWGMAATALLGAGAAIWGSKKAADAAEEGAAKANALSQQVYAQQRADQMPYMQSGYQALNAYNRLMGLNPVDVNALTQNMGPGGLKMIPVQFHGKGVLVDAEGNGYIQAVSGSNAGTLIPIGKKYPQYAQPTQQTSGATPTTASTTPQDRYGGFYASPGYQFRLDEGTRALDRSAAARGMLLSGAQVKAQTRYGQGVASDEFNSYANRLAAIAGLGQTANQNVSGAAGQYGVNAANAAMNTGYARASGYMGTANTIGSIANGVMASIPYWGSNNVNNRLTQDANNVMGRAFSYSRV
jgi:hypothetical protein